MTYPCIVLRTAIPRRARGRGMNYRAGTRIKISALNFSAFTYRKLSPPVNANTISAGHYHANAAFASLGNILYSARAAKALPFYIGCSR